MKDFSYIGRAIEAEMLLTKISKERMSKRIGKSVRQLDRYLSGETIIPLEVLVEMNLSEATWERIRHGN